MKIADVIWQLIVAGILSYLFGNINSAVIISKKFKHQDIRQQGSKNPGTTNMLRVFGMKIGAITLICDVVKGIVPVLAAHFIFKAMGCAILTYRFAMYFCAFCVTIGHVFPVFMKFRGGKGFCNFRRRIFGFATHSYLDYSYDRTRGFAYLGQNVGFCVALRHVRTVVSCNVPYIGL